MKKGRRLGASGEEMVVCGGLNQSVGHHQDVRRTFIEEPRLATSDSRYSGIPPKFGAS
jgi:hypothetical protein